MRRRSKAAHQPKPPVVSRSPSCTLPQMDTPGHCRSLLTAALLACAVASAGAQPAPQQQGSYYDYMGGKQMRVSTTMVALLAAVVAVFVFIALATIYLRQCTGYRYDVGLAATGRLSVLPAEAFVSSRQRWPRGLDAEVIEMFPTMRYAEAKALRVGKVAAALECAVCLSEFEDEEKLRLLPKCSHAFHPDCIGEWLASHVTCPVCRRNLDPSRDTSSFELVRLPAPQANSASSETAVLRQEDGAQAVVIDVVTEEDEEERRKEAMELQQIGTQRRAMRSRSGRRPFMARLVRSHSTGHSLAVRLDRDLERFTLRLPEHVRREMAVASGELSSRRRQRTGEGSSRGGDRLRRSGRWPSFLSYTGTLSGRLPSFFSASRRADRSFGGEVSSSSSSSCARSKGKRVAAVDVAEGSGKAGVRLDRIGGSVSGAKVGAVAVDVEKGG